MILKGFLHILFEDWSKSVVYLPEGEMTEVIISRNVGWSKECEMWDIPVQWILLPVKEVVRRGGVVTKGVCTKLFK